MNKGCLRALVLVAPVGWIFTGCGAMESDLAGGGDGGLAYGEDGGYDGDGGTGGDDGGAGDGAADDGGPDAPLPDDEPQTQEPPQECNDQDEVSLFLSPDDSNSMSSPVQLREAALDGFASVMTVPIRTWEFLNYYDFAYPAAQAGDLAVYTDLRRLDDDESQYVLQIGIASEEISNDNRDPMALTLVLDTSGSMQGIAMEMLKETCHAIAATLQEGDVVSMVTWDTSNATVLGGYKVDGPNDSTVVGKCNELEAGGGTDLHGGLTAGYDLANQVYQKQMINRIVLISDGGANAGVTDVDIIAENTTKNGEDGIYMVGVGVGDANSYHDDLMDVVTDAGKGASVFINDADEAWKVFNRDFVSTMAVAARNVQVRLDMPPGFEVVKFSGEEISENPDEVEPQHLAPSDTMVFHQTLSTCAPDLVQADTTFTVAVEYQDARNFETRNIEQTLNISELIAADHALLLKGAAVFEYAEQVKAYQQAASPEERKAAIAIALDALAAAQAANPEDPDLVEIGEVLAAL